MEQQELIFAGTHPACSPKMPPNPHVLSGSTDVFFSALKSKLAALHDSMAIQTAVLFFTSHIFPIIYRSKGGKSSFCGKQVRTPLPIGRSLLWPLPGSPSRLQHPAQEEFPVTEDAQAYPGLLPQLLDAILLCWTPSSLPSSSPIFPRLPQHTSLFTLVWSCRCLVLSGFGCSVLSARGSDYAVTWKAPALAQRAPGDGSE